MINYKRFIALIIVFLLAQVNFARGAYAPKVEVPEGSQEDVRKGVAAIKRLPRVLRQSFMAEKLGLCFQPNGGNVYAREAEELKPVGVTVRGYYAYTPAVFVGSDGKVCGLRATQGSLCDKIKEKGGYENLQFAVKSIFEGYPEAVLVKFSDEITQMCTRTAKNRLDVLPAHLRDAFLAELSRQLYMTGGQEVYSGKKNRTQANGTDAIIERDEVNSGAMFADSMGEEHDFCRLVHDEVNSRDLYRSAWELCSLCVELVGKDAILALYPEEVKSIRQFRKDVEKHGAPVVKGKRQTKSSAPRSPETSRSITALNSMPRTLREAYLAERLGLCFLSTGEDAYREGGMVSTREGMRISHYPTDARARFVDSRGKEYTLSEKMNKGNYKQNADSLKKWAADAVRGIYGSDGDRVLDEFEKEIADMAAQTAKNRLSTFPALLRCALLAETEKLLFLPYGGNAYTGKTREWKIRSCQRNARWPEYDENAHFIAADGKDYKAEDVMRQYNSKYGQHILLCRWCVVLAGKEDVLAGFAKEVAAMKKYRSEREKAPQAGKHALTEEQRWAWLAEKMGFCYAEDGADAYQSARVANGNAVYVDAQGKVCRLAEAPGKDSPGWAEATNAALAMGFDEYTAPYVEEIKQLAAQTSRSILASMPPELRQSWLAERNKFFFMSDSGDPYSRDEKPTLESGIEYSFRGTGWNYGKCMYYDPSGKLVSTTRVERVWAKRWSLLYYCEVAAGIDAINQPFREEVDAMRTAFKRSLSSQK